MSMSAATDKPKDVAALFERALALCQAGRFSEGESAFRRILEFEPGHGETLHFLGMVCSQLGNHAEALRHIDAALQLNAEAPAVHSSRGNVLAALKRLDEALASFDKAIALDPHSPMVFSNRGNAQLELGRLEEAVASYDRAIALDPDDAEARYGRGSTLQQLGRLDEAVASYDRAIAIRPDYAEAFNNRGVALQDLKRFDEALASYDQAIAIRPGFPEALNNCGSALQAAKRFDEALASYDRAIALKPDFAEAWSNRGTVLQRLKRFDEALASYDQAIALRPDYAEAFSHRGDALAKLNRLDEALASYERVVVLSPKHAPAHINLGNMLLKFGRFPEALAQFRKAFAINPRDPIARDCLANALNMLGRTEEEVAHFRHVIAMSPNDAGAHNGLGLAFQSLGRLDEAIDVFEKAIALAPGKAVGYLNLANSQRLTAADPHFATMREMAREMPSLDPEDQIALHFALGKAFADIDDPQQAFRHMIEGNLLKRQQIVYHEVEVLARFERIRAVFTAQLMRDKQGWGDPSSVPVFIVGMLRSGSTLVEQILASHPMLFGAGEIDLMGRIASRISGPNGGGFPEAITAQSREQLRQLGELYLQGMRGMAPIAQRITDKRLDNFALIGFIHLALPNARIIHTRRDPLDVAFSCFSRLFAGVVQNHTYDLAEFGRYYRAYETLMQHWRNVLPEGVMIEVQYEDVVGDLEAQARQIVAHCGLEWDNACLSFHKTERPVRTASAIQVRQPIYDTSIGRWREYEDLLRPFVQARAGSTCTNHRELG